jgi:archaellum component FlaF (FlaF/FlaG flagellin family)
VKSTAEQALEKATAAATATDLATVKGIAEKAATDAAKGIKDAADANTAAAAAQKAADEAKAALADYAKTSDLADYVKNSDLETKLADYVTSSALAEAVAAAKQQIETFIATSEGNFEALKADVEKFKGAYNQIWNAVTSVSLYGAVYPKEDTDNDIALYSPDNLLDLTFCVDKIAKADKRFTRFDDMIAAGTDRSKHDGYFADPNKPDYFFGAENYSAAEGVSYTDGTVFKFPTSIFVRVSPTNATLTKDNVKLINGLGKALSVVEIADVVPAPNLYTRAGSVSGLWEIKVNATDAMVANSKGMNKATLVDVGTTDAYSTDAAITGATEATVDQILYAVAINNTTDVDDASDRNVVSEYGLTVKKSNPITTYTGVYTPDILTDAKINKVALNNVRARYANGVLGAKTTREWKFLDASNADQGTTVISTDNRSAATNVIRINNGGTVTVDFTKVVNAQNFTPQYYYVTRDDANAGGSDASELNAWKSYQYAGNLNTLLDPATKCEFTVTIPETLTTGDFIGFRIFAVNYDGTVCDPDGIPFEIWVGATKESQSISGEYVPTKQAGEKFVYAFTPTIKTGIITNGETIQFKTSDDKNVGTAWGAKLLDADKAPTTDWSKVAYVELTSTDVTKWTDEASYSGVIEYKASATPGDVTVNEIFVELKKVMPGFGKAIWKTAQPGDPQNTNKYISYMEAETGSTHTRNWTALADNGFENLVDAMNNLTQDADHWYEFVIENVVWDATANAFAKPGKFTNNGTATCYVDVARALVDGTTAHAVKWYYTYKNISSVTTKEPNTNTDTKNYYVEGTPFEITFACALDPSVMKYSWINTFNCNPTNWSPAAGAPTAAVDAKLTDVYVVYNVASKFYGDVEYTNASGKKFTATKVDLGDDLSKLLVYENSYDNTWFRGGTTKNIFWPGKNYLDGSTALWAGWTPWGDYMKASVATKGGAADGVKEYFLEGTINTGADITLPVNSSASQPASAVPSTLTITAVDAFGHVKDIVSLPISVHRD